MHLVLDSNEYILAFGSEQDPTSEKLITPLALKPEKYPLSICRPVLEEVARHLLPLQLGEVHAFLRALGVEIDERWVVPFEFAERSITRGLKRGDAFIS